MRKFTFLSFVFSMIMAFSGLAQKSFVNVAAKYCAMLGYRYEINVAKTGGETGIIHLPDGKMVNAWDLYKGKVAQEYFYSARLGFEIKTELINENGYSIGSPVCVRSNKSFEERIPLN